MSKAERAQIRWGARASTALPCLAVWLSVCHSQSIVGVVTRSWIIDSCRQLAAYVTADSVKHHTVRCSGTAAGVDIHSARTQVAIIVHENADKATVCIWKPRILPRYDSNHCGQLWRDHIIDNSLRTKALQRWPFVALFQSSKIKVN